MKTEKSIKPTKCTPRCKSCKYHTYLSSGSNFLACGYILDKRERRGCPAGDKCIRYEEGVPKRNY